MFWIFWFRHKSFVSCRLSQEIVFDMILKQICWAYRDFLSLCKIKFDLRRLRSHVQRINSSFFRFHRQFCYKQNQTSVSKRQYVVNSFENGIKWKFSEWFPWVKIRFKFETDNLTFFPSVGIEFGCELLAHGFFQFFSSRKYSHVENKSYNLDFPFRCQLATWQNACNTVHDLPHTCFELLFELN